MIQMNKFQNCLQIRIQYATKNMNDHINIKQFCICNFQIKMQDKKDKKQLQVHTFRSKILPLFSTKVQIHKIPLCTLQIVFQVIMFIQMLKFPIDYFSKNWFGYYQPIFSFLDLSYYEKYISQNDFQSTLIFLIISISIYWMSLLVLYLIKFKYGQSSANLRRLLLLLVSTIFYMPILNTLLNLFNCEKQQFFRPCLIQKNQVLIGVTIFTFSVFASMVIMQSFLRFQFIEDEKVYKRIKNSAFMSVGLILYVTVNQLTFYYLDQVVKLIILDISIVLMLTVFFLKDQHFQESAKLLELNMLVINAIPIVMINAMYFLKTNLNFPFLLILWPISVVAIQIMNIHTLQFELDNINKWNTPAMMIRYTESLRKLIKRNQDYYFQIQLHGYMEIHKQKCDNVTCPYNVESIRLQEQLLKTEHTLKIFDQVLRTEGMIKNIFNDGCKVSPINPQLQLQYAHFLFDIQQKQASLKHLLLIKYSDLSFYRYYKYVILKDKIQDEMCEKPERQFLDLVSQLEVKRKEQEIMHKFQQAALINLQFWSVLNQDHPDFQKLNQVGSSRVRIGQQVRQRYQDICKYAHSQKTTNFYVHFLTSIENNEQIYNHLYDQIRKRFNLDQKITLQDWSNSSQSTLLVSIECANYGTMIDLNSTCASMFGYEKYEVVNRHLKAIFSQQMRDQIKSFLNPKLRDQAFFMSHKNSYLLKITRKVQTYNSMQTGMTSICTLNNIISLNSCFIVFTKEQKAIGLSSSCISLLGIDYKMFEQKLYLKDILNITLQQVKRSSAIGNQSFKLTQLLKLQTQTPWLDCRKDPYSLAFYGRTDGIFWIEFTVSRGKRSQKPENVPVKKFQFQVQTTLTEFKYIGVGQSDQSPYLSQFSQLNFAESFNDQQVPQDYSQNITTLRLKDNIIQVIEEYEDQLSQLHIKKESQTLREQIQALSRKNQQAIFASKQTFQKFISDYQITRSIRLILLVGIVITIGAYVSFYFIFINHNHITTEYFQEIAYQNLIIGSIAKHYALITTVQLMKAGVSKRIPTSYYTITLNNLNYLQSIKLLGSDPFPLTTYISATSSRQSYSDEFLLSYINYAVNMISGMNGKVTQPELVIQFNKIQKFKVDYLKLNGVITRKQMQKNIQQREGEILQLINTDMNVQFIMLAIGIAFLILLGVVLALAIFKINKEKINTLQIFLGITEQQIQKFSSKTQRFLVSLHVQDTTGQVDLDEENENKKVNSSTFSKKKRFKLVGLSKAIYFKVLIIPILAQVFFVQSFFQSYSSLQFMRKSIPYMTLTSAADTIFYGGIGIVQNAILNKGTDQGGLTNDYLEYYRRYFDYHYQTFGQIPSFHRAFNSIFMEDICDGQIKIPSACNLPFLSKNGNLLIFTDITVRTQSSDFSQDFTNDYYVAFSVISASHKYLTTLVLEQQKKLVVEFEKSLLNYLIIWIFVVIGASLVYGLFVLNGFIKEVNQNKNMVMLLPISIAKSLSEVKVYINSILRSQTTC